MRWAFLGIGRVTPRMVSALRAIPHQQLCAVAARNPESLRTWAQSFSVDRITTDLEHWCVSDDIDAVYVALPPSLHAELSILALRHRKTVLSEKPLAIHSNQATAMFNASRDNLTLLQHATSFPFHPRSRAMRSIIKSGELGELKRITVSVSFSEVMHRGSDHRTQPSLGGGCLLDLGWYCAFATRWFTDLHPIEIKALGNRLSSDHPEGVWGSAQAIVRLNNDAIAHWDCGFDASGRKWIEIAGSKGSLICDDFTRPWDLSKPRFWVHGLHGKARSETVGADCFQEKVLFESMAAGVTEESSALLECGVLTQRDLELWENAL